MSNGLDKRSTIQIIGGVVSVIKCPKCNQDISIPVDDKSVKDVVCSCGKIVTIINQKRKGCL